MILVQGDNNYVTLGWIDTLLEAIMDSTHQVEVTLALLVSIKLTGLLVTVVLDITGSWYGSESVSI
jgi:hypothetical protein